MDKQHPVIEKYAMIAQNLLKKIPAETLEKMNQESIEATEVEYEQFRTDFANGLCYLCRDELENFNQNKPCVHWLLRPAGFDKKHFALVYGKFNYLQIQSYLRWIANTEVIAGNINNLEQEKNPAKIIEYTIKYKNLEWSFSCSKGDLAGHESGFYGRKPHYHFQMRINCQPFINYSEFHVPLGEEDLFYLPLLLGVVEKATYSHYYGAGMQEMMDSIDSDVLLNSMQRADGENEGVYNIQTFVEAVPGKTISGDDIAKLFKKSKETNVPISRLIVDLNNIGDVKRIISPGPRVPDQAGRKGGRKFR